MKRGCVRGSPRQQAAHRRVPHEPQTDPDRCRTHQHAAQVAGRQRPARNEHLQEWRCDGAHPPGLQPRDHQPGIAGPGRYPEKPAHGGHQAALCNQQARGAGSRKAHCQQGADLAGTLLDGQPKQQHDQDQRGQDDEHAECQEQHVERRGARRGGQAALPDRLELEAQPVHDRPERRG